MGFECRVSIYHYFKLLWSVFKCYILVSLKYFHNNCCCIFTVSFRKLSPLKLNWEVQMEDSIVLMKRVRSTSRNQADLCFAAAVIVLFCKQYDIIKDNDSNNHSKEKSKPLSGQSTPEYHHGGLLGSKVRPSPRFLYIQQILIKWSCFAF